MEETVLLKDLKKNREVMKLYKKLSNEKVVKLLNEDDEKTISELYDQMKKLYDTNDEFYGFARQEKTGLDTIYETFETFLYDEKRCQNFTKTDERFLALYFLLKNFGEDDLSKINYERAMHDSEYCLNVFKKLDSSNQNRAINLALHVTTLNENDYHEFIKEIVDSEDYIQASLICVGMEKLLENAKASERFREEYIKSGLSSEDAHALINFIDKNGYGAIKGYIAKQPREKQESLLRLADTMFNALDGESEAWA